jgi:hypothetical protein
MRAHEAVQLAKEVLDGGARAPERGLGAGGALDVAVLAGAIVLALGLGAATLRRRTP